TITKHWDDGQVNSALGEIHPQVNLGELFMLLGNGAPVDVQKAAAGDKLTLSGIAPGAYELAEVGVEGYTPAFKIFNRVSESLEEVTGQKAEDGSWKIPVTVADAQELKVDVTNIKNSSSPPPQPKGSIEVEKLWNNGNGSSSVPEGANIAELFVLLKNNQPVQVQNSVSEGILKFDDIEPGEDYELAELKFQNYSPEFKIEEGDSWNPMIDTAYEDKGWKVPVKVEADQTVKVRVTNCKPAIPVEEPKGGITITKQWVDFNNKTITAPEEDLSKLFTLRKCEEASTLSAASIIQGTISESSRTLNFSNLSYGTYVLTESKIDGYTPDFIVAGTHQEAQYDAQKGWWITIDVNKKDAVSVEVINKKAEPKAGIEARVTWLDSKDNVITDPGINLLDILTVKDSKGNIVSGASLVNGAVRWESLPLGTYTFEEKQLDGYETSITMNENTVKVSKVTVGLSADKQLAEISVVNKAKDKAVEVVADTGNNLPRTDRTFEEEYIMMILGILAFGVGAVLKLRKQHVK
ncbi:MAG: hypothetical protein Q8930_16805, partial [Bacillota bacterium]|nr:hypothetical protein [Bacillota bacterium]